VAPERVTVEVDGEKLSLSNLDKVLYPDVGFTKGQVIDYYARIADTMLPHLESRGVTLRRYPNGVDAQSFFEKRCASHRPDFVGTALGPGDRRGGIHYCVLDNKPALVWAANMAALEIHAPMARAPDIESPTMVVFDLDPGEPATIVECAQVALDIRDVLDHLELESYARARVVLRPRHRPAPGEAAAQAGDVGDGQGRPAGEDLRGLEPELPPQDDDRAVQPPGPTASDGFHAGVVGRGAGLCRG
jgi:hypothetical protein